MRLRIGLRGAPPERARVAPVAGADSAVLVSASEHAERLGVGMVLRDELLEQLAGPLGSAASGEGESLQLAQAHIFGMIL